MAPAKCPRCGFDDVIEKKVDKLIRGGNDAAVVNILADVCLHCGEQMYSLDTALQFDYIREKLSNQQVDDFQPMGRFFHIPAGYGEKESEERRKELLKSFDSAPLDKTP